MSNPSVLANWLQRWNQSLLRFLRRRAHAVEVEDVAQETYLRLLRSPDLTEVRNPQAYLLRVASHVVSEWHHGRRSLESLADVDEDALIDLCTPEFELEAAVSEARLNTLLASVSPVMRAVLVLRLRDGHAYKEIAQQLGLTDRQVRRHLARGYERLRQVLEN